jgi:Xaa-Pro aminopeptidase
MNDDQRQFGGAQRHARAAAPGPMNVDWEERLNVERLRAYRLGRARQALDASEAGALLTFDMNNVRYLTSTHLGEWARDKLCRYALLARGGDPYLWDFGSAAANHRMYSPWLKKDHCRAGMLGMRGSIAPDAGLFSRAAKEVTGILRDEGLATMPLAVDVAELPMIEALRAEGLTVIDGQQIMLDAREIKSADEIVLINTACAMVDATYQMISEMLKPGIRENQLVAQATRLLYELGSEDVEGINAISGERCSPHPHVFSDRLVRPGDQAYFDILHSFNGYRTCYYRTFAVGRATPAQREAYSRAREWIDVAIDLVKPGVSTDVIAQSWPTAEQLGFADEFECFGLEFGHGVGLNLHERPIISRLNSLDHPMEIKEGMVFALETYCPATDGYSAARIEEMVVVTAGGCEVMTLFPSEELPVANAY